MDFTVAICTYNGGDRISKVLDRLAVQVETQGIDWEVLVVDNNSTDNTAAVVEKYARNWRSDSQVRYAFEPRQGPAYARCHAVLEAESNEFIGFLDDDNLPAPNWLISGYQFGRHRPRAGAFGGIVHPLLDVEPPPYFDGVKIYLTIYNYGSIPLHFRRSDKPRRIPAAPGSVVRKQAWQQAVPPAEKLLIKGRDEKTMAAGEDAEVMFYIQNSDWEVWYNPKMEVWHHIPSDRLEPDYLRKLARGYGLSTHLTRLARHPAWQRPFVALLAPVYALYNGWQAGYFYCQNQQDLEVNFGKACELESQIGKAYSPFLGWYRRFIVGAKSIKNEESLF